MPLSPSPTPLALVSLVLLGQAMAQTPAEPAAAAAPPRPAASAPAARPAPGAAATPQQVEITGSTAADGQDERRRATASRIVYGREELDRMGDSSIGEVLKRLPGVSIGGGPPGRGGQVRMRGMGGGYTQILIDGQRMPPGFSLDSIPPEQVERIEVMRAPVAEFGTRAIAGTINVVMRSDFKRRTNEWRAGGGADGRQPQLGGSWVRNGQTDALGYNFTTTVFRGGQDNDSTTRTLGLAPDGSTTLDQTRHSRFDNRRSGLFANGRLQFRLAPGSGLDLQPFLNLVRSHGSGLSTLDRSQGEVPYSQAQWDTRTQWQMGRLNGTWLSGTPEGGRLQLRFGSTLSSSDSHTERLETGGNAGAGVQRLEDSGQRELSLDLNGKFSQLLAERHSASAGFELQQSRRNDRRVSLVDGRSELAEFGENLEARTLRAALYAQDEWEWSKAFSFYLGARWEGIQTESDSALARVSNRSSVLTPLAHLVWKLPDNPRDQVRASLTRSYRSPNTSQLIARPSLSSLYPDLSRGNQPTSPDRAGNPALKPELAWGLELGYEHYLAAGGIFSVNAYLRRIDDLIRTVRSLETVSYASVPRWVARPQNIGAADAAGLEFEAKARASDLWATSLPLSLRANASLMWSRVNQVPGPNNRLEGQPRYTANLGADLPLRGTPLTLGGSWNYTPSFEVQQIDNQRYRQGVKSVLDGYALWRFSGDASARLTLSNALARQYDSGLATTLADGSVQSTDTSARSYTTVNLRAELRF